MGQEPPPPAENHEVTVDTLASEVHEFINREFGEKNIPNPLSKKKYEEIPDGAKMVRQAVARWAVERFGNGVSPAALAQMNTLKEYARGLHLQNQELVRSVVEFQSSNARPMEPIDPFSLIPLTRTQETEAAVQKAMMDAAILMGGKKFEKQIRKINIAMNAQLMLAIGIMGFLIIRAIMTPVA